jgi:hypothetical protein
VLFALDDDEQDQESSAPAQESSAPAQESSAPAQESSAPAQEYEQKVDVEKSDNKFAEIVSATQVNFARSMAKAIDNRLDVLGNNSTLISAGQGENIVSNSVWTAGFIGSDRYKGVSRSNFAGGSIGADFLINDVDIVGFAFTKAYNRGRSNDVASKSYADLTSVYGLLRFGDAFFTTSAFVGQVKTKAENQDSKGVITSAKFGNSLYGVNASIGYEIKEQRHIFTPFVNLAFFGAKQGGCKKNGQDASNVKKSYERSISSLAALKYSYLIDSDHSYLMPKVIVGFTKNLSQKAPIFSAAQLQDGDLLNVSKGRPNKVQTTFFISPGIIAKSQYFDIDLSYLFEKSRKFTGHIGALKLRIKI